MKAALMKLLRDKSVDRRVGNLRHRHCRLRKRRQTPVRLLCNRCRNACRDQQETEFQLPHPVILPDFRPLSNNPAGKPEGTRLGRGGEFYGKGLDGSFPQSHQIQGDSRWFGIK